MTLHAREWVSVVELIFYIPTSIVALWICSRHGFRRSSGWIYTLLLCIIRIAGAICELSSWNNPSNTSLMHATIIIDSIGLSPLLLATLGMLSRFVDFINASSSHPTLSTKHFRLIQILITVGLILSIAGGSSNSTNSDGQLKVSTTSRVGIVLYIVAFVALVLVFFLSVLHSSIIPHNERRVPLAVLFALPFILVRLVYSACSVFLHNHLFNIINGSVVVLVVMAVLEEFIVVVVYLILGFFVDKLDKSNQGPIASREWKNKRGKKHRGAYDVEGQQQNGVYVAPQGPPHH
ncbi:hypothetical protein BDV96DRAFT_540673 [Lophiotrema nucula]|uniref:DUF7702 domain-containing protein n=1 Tax=Lophiotrema nucula TaxID=690887 RepID=A0A6A5ZKT4_9PLEO|nr:hypothetical protein BDV96DRAFT_540673 [Lophiotrema nucula]